MTVLSSGLRRELERAVVAGRGVAEEGVRAALSTLGVFEDSKPSHLDDDQARLRRGLRAKQRQLGGGREVLVWDAAYEQWHRLLFARFLAERGLLRHPSFDAPVTLADCDELAAGLGEPDGWSVAGRFAAEILPGIFRLDDPCVQLRLAPEHRQRLQQIVTGLPDEMFVADDSLGWVYQYWQSERKDEVNASESKIGGADLGPVTQLFTENYMVRFLLENSLGAWWAGRHPDSPLLDDFEFLRFDGVTDEPATGAFEQWPDSVAEVTVMDPCCGSGHFLVEAFKMLWAMRAEEEELGPVAAQNAVLEDNLFGLELDPRCVQIAMFAVALQAWADGGGWRELPTPNIACSGIPAKAPLEEWTQLAYGDPRLEAALERLHRLFREADTLGSLIDPRRATEMANAAGLQRSFEDVDFNEVAPLLEKAASREADDPATAVIGADAAGIARAAALLSRTYTLVATNVPYLKRANQAEALRSYVERSFGAAIPDLSVTFMARANHLALSGSSALVVPYAWTTQATYQDFREEVLENWRLLVVALLGTGAFSEISGEVVNVLLMVAGGAPHVDSVAVLDLAHAPEPAGKAAGLAVDELRSITQSRQIENPDSRLLLEDLPDDVEFLTDYAGCFQGTSTGDNARFILFHWEMPDIEHPWERWQTTVSSHVPFGGREQVCYWHGPDGVEETGAAVRGRSAWNRPGAAISQMGRLWSTFYGGQPFDNNVAAMVPRDPDVLPAVFAYITSDEYHDEVRKVDLSMKVMNGTLPKVPFDVDRWRRAAQEQFPDGLPEPWTDDPTQWLFEGHPAGATDPLQVAMGRLVGYRWPEQPEDDGLNGHTDDDGIVCLPAVGGEQPAAERLEELLAAAFGDDWGPGSVRKLLAQAGSKKKTLEDWLARDFFKEHCSVFSNRPFVWHITDNHAGGFSALVNYHKLDRACLEKLTYAYLGDWIEQQAAAASDGTAGADTRLAAAQELKEKLQLILEGEPPFDIFVRWKQLHEQPIGWDPDLDDGVRLNIRPFMTADVLAGPKSVPRVHWKKDRGKNPDGSVRHNDLHHTNDEKRGARQEANTE